jgi:hypothetical protein
MAGFKLLVDTNIVIALEDPQPVEASLSELVRLCNEYSVGIFVDEATYEDVYRDDNAERRAVTLSKLEKFQKLRGISVSLTRFSKASSVPSGTSTTAQMFDCWPPSTRRQSIF